VRIAIATCRPLPEPDHDEELMLYALQQAGFECEMLPWQERDGEGFDAVLIRSTWNYHLHIEEFTEWLRLVASQTVLFNPLPVLLGNLHKRYLLQLASAGVPVVPTVRVSGEYGCNFFDEFYDFYNSTPFVIKPVVGASSHLTQVFARNSVDAAIRFLDDHFQDADALVQPYLSSVERGGERALVWIDGKFTHKVVKQPRFKDGEESVSHAQELTTAERVVGEFAIEKYRAIIEGEVKTGKLPDGSTDLLYARVDVMDDDEGQTVVSELELAEPSLFFMQHPSALDRFVLGVASRL